MTGMHREPGDQRDLTARLLWFRSDNPEGEVETELVVAEEAMAVCRATLRTQTSGSSSSHGSAHRDQDGSTYVELAEDRALSRALAALGYAAVPTDEAEDDEQAEQSPPIDLVSARTLLREEPPSPEHDEVEQKRQETRQSPGDASSAETTDDNGADVNWNKFWNWARPRGYTTAKELNDLLGVDNVLAFTPREVRQMLIKYEMDNPPGGQDE